MTSSTLVSFIVPTLWRPSLEHTLDSIQAQTDGNWECLVIGDPGVFPGAIREDPRIKALIAGPARQGSAGLLRNLGMMQSKGKWVGFVDDDDTVAPTYVESLRDADLSSDICVFRMHHLNFGILPPPAQTQASELSHGGVGISFAVRNDYARSHFFVRESVGTSYNEDWEYLKEARDLGAEISLHPLVAYYVRDARPST